MWRARVTCGDSRGKANDRGFIYLFKYFLSVCVVGIGDVVGDKIDEIYVFLEFLV